MPRSPRSVRTDTRWRGRSRSRRGSACTRSCSAACTTGSTRSWNGPTTTSTPPAPPTWRPLARPAGSPGRRTQRTGRRSPSAEPESALPSQFQPADAVPRSQTMSEHYDVIIIGSRAGGGTLAHRLAPSGKKVLILERGDWLPREVQNWDATAVFVDNRYVSPDTWYDKDGKTFQPQVHYNVGGATKLYGAALYRLREKDFGELHHHEGIPPAWPVSYQDFEPYYTQAEQLYQVHGIRGEDPTEPPGSAPYPFPPVSNEPRIQQLYDDLKKVGMTPFHAPVGILLNEAVPAFSACIRCATCDGFPCLVHAKSDAEVIAVRPAITHQNVTLLRNAHVQRLDTDATGRTVTTVVATVDGVQPLHVRVAQQGH